MKIKSQRDFWSGLMFLVTGALFAWGAIANYNFGSSARPGPGYFPFGLGVLLALLGAFILFEALTIETEDGRRLDLPAQVYRYGDAAGLDGEPWDAARFARESAASFYREHAPAR